MLQATLETPEWPRRCGPATLGGGRTPEEAPPVGSLAPTGGTRANNWHHRCSVSPCLEKNRSTWESVLPRGIEIVGSCRTIESLKPSQIRPKARGSGMIEPPCLTRRVEGGPLFDDL